MYDMRRVGGGDVVAVVAMMLFLLVESHADAEGPSVCPSLCRCTTGSTTVVSCFGVARVPVRLPPSTVVLDLDHNHISLLTNASFGRAVPLHRLEDLSLQDNGLLHIEAGALVSLTELRVLRLGRNHLSSLPTSVFAANRQLRVLDVHANYFTVLPDGVLRQLHSLAVLNVSFNHLTSSRLGPGFRYITQLSHLDLSGNDFESISSDVFDVAQWWDDDVPRHINLSYCNVRYLGDYVFRPVPRLRSLSLAGNVRLRAAELEVALAGLSSPPSALDTVILSHANVSDVQSLVRRLQTATNITRLELAYNRIRAVPKRTFFFLPALHHLDLSHNEIVDVDGLSGLARLEYLGLAFNALERVESSMFEGLHELRYLDISYNAIVGDLDAEALLGLFNLRTVDISGNRVRGVVVDGGGLESLEVLSASFNRISDLRFVGRLPRLRSVDLSHNAVVRVLGDVFPLGQRVELLNLSGNAISDVATGALRRVSVGTIDLSSNRLTRLDDIGWKSVSVLLAHDNDITQVTDAALSAVLTSLNELHLQRNQLQTLPRAVFDEPTDSKDTAVLQVFDVSSNPVGPYVDSLEQSESTVGLRPTMTVLRLRDVGLSRWPTRLLLGLDTLTTLDLGENTLTTIPAGSLAPLVRLERLDVSLNRIVSVDPWRLMRPSSRQPPSVDVSGNPLDCTCSITALCSHLFPADGLVYTTWVNTTASRTSYQCKTPAEWHGVELAKFCADADEQCSTLPSVVLAASIGAVVVVVATLMAAVICRRCVEYRRRRGVPGTKAAVAAAGCRSDSYKFVDETSLTSSSNSSSAATTTSGMPVPLPPGLHHSAPKPPTNSHGHDEFLLRSGRQWL